MRRLLLLVMLMAACGKAEQKQAQIVTIEESAYELLVKDHSAEGRLVLSGRVISGGKTPICFFDKEVVITEIQRLKGGRLLSQPDGTILFLPDGEKKFHVVLEFLVRTREDSKSRFVSFDIPAGMKNSLLLKLPAENRLLEHPGIADADGTYHFSADTPLIVRFSDKKALAFSRTDTVEIDTLSRVRIQGRRAIITTVSAPVQKPPASFVLDVPEGARYSSSTLKESWIRKMDDTSYRLELPADQAGPFTIQFSLDDSVTGDGLSFHLPVIRENEGKEGHFIFEEPEDAETTIMANGLQRNVAAKTLSRDLLQAAGRNRFLMHIPSSEPISVTVKRFKSVPTPPIVLDSMSFYTAFEENGVALSVLRMVLPETAGSRVRVRSVPDAKIWFLRVNGKAKKVYADNDGSWVVPLAEGKESRVELAFLQRSEKLGLHGRLESIVPATGLPSRNVHIGLALPERVQLLSVEGPINQSQARTKKLPVEFIGKRHFFSRSFYKGDGMKIAASYKEPVKRN